MCCPNLHKAPGQNGTEVKGILSRLLPPLSRYSQGSGHPVFSHLSLGWKSTHRWTHTGFCCLWNSPRTSGGHTTPYLLVHVEKKGALMSRCPVFDAISPNVLPKRKEEAGALAQGALQPGEVGGVACPWSAGSLGPCLMFYCCTVRLQERKRIRRATGYPRRKPS